MEKKLLVALFLACGISACGAEQNRSTNNSESINLVNAKSHFSSDKAGSDGGACYITVIRGDVNDTQCYDDVSLQTCIKIKNQVVDSTYRFEAGKSCR